MLYSERTSASIWTRFGEQLHTVFRDADPRVCIAFWMFGAHHSYPITARPNLR